MPGRTSSARREPWTPEDGGVSLTPVQRQVLLVVFLTFLALGTLASAWFSDSLWSLVSIAVGAFVGYVWFNRTRNWHLSRERLWRLAMIGMVFSTTVLAPLARQFQPSQRLTFVAGALASLLAASAASVIGKAD